MLTTGWHPGAVGLCVAPRGPQNRASTTGCHFYAREILAHAGFAVAEVPRAGLPGALAADTRPRALVLAGDVELDAAGVDALRRWVEAGGALIGVGSASGAEALWGVAAEAPPAGFAVGACTLGEGAIEPVDRGHPVVAGLLSALHVFNGQAVRAAGASVIAALRDAHGRPTDRAAITARPLGAGIAILIAADVPGSVALIQQGRTVDQDGTPAPDGSAPTSDNVLKADDGLVLDWLLDRAAVEGAPYPIFLHPVADELREVLVRAILHGARHVGAALPLLWTWPRGLPALGHISHDSDGNSPEDAMAMLEAVTGLGLRDTWCVLAPGYPREVFEALRGAGQEIALHFDALEQGVLSEWREENLAAQYASLSHAAGSRPVTNKNHYTRWEGRLEFFRWCAAAGIASDQSRGPSKVGEGGFPFGTAQPFFPMDDDGATVDCLEVGFASQDFVVFLPPVFVEPLVESAARVNGVAHVIFHPAHIGKPGVRDALRAFVAACRARGMEFWTNAEIDAWERARRQARLEPDGSGWRLTSARPMSGATVLLPPSGRPAGPRVRRYGFEFDVVTGDVDEHASLALPAA